MDPCGVAILTHGSAASAPNHWTSPCASSDCFIAARGSLAPCWCIRYRSIHCCSSFAVIWSTLTLMTRYRCSRSSSARSSPFFIYECIKMVLVSFHSSPAMVRSAQCLGPSCDRTNIARHSEAYRTTIASARNASKLWLKAPGSWPRARWQLLRSISATHSNAIDMRVRAVRRCPSTVHIRDARPDRIRRKCTVRVRAAEPGHARQAAAHNRDCNRNNVQRTTMLFTRPQALLQLAALKQECLGRQHLRIQGLAQGRQEALLPQCLVQ